ncbi:MAG: spermidine synthase, partial [Planctomycetota bacterium]
MIAALGLAFLSGFIALSYEILWYRAFSFASGTAANTFGLLLGAYLLGLALGALAIRRVCRDTDAAARSLQLAFLVRLIVFANLIGFLVVPCLGLLVTAGMTRTWSLLAVGVAAAGLGTVFPLISHLAIEPDDRAGRRVSYVYLTNILGSTAGSLGTGFVLMDHLSLAAIHVLLFFLGLAMAMLPLFLNTGSRRTGASAAIGVLGLACALFGTTPFDRIYEKLQLKTEYTRDRRFKHVVETRSGVITVNEDDQIFGGGIYDGAFNTRLYPDKNLILRCYAAIAELHPAPREVLMIGLSSGSWATVVANHP